MSEFVKHKARVHYGDWHAFAYCTTAECGWEGKHTNLYYAYQRDLEGRSHSDYARQHERKMNRWWQRLLFHVRGVPVSRNQKGKLK